jgi:hypothetical protein
MSVDACSEHSISVGGEKVKRGVCRVRVLAAKRGAVACDLRLGSEGVRIVPVCTLFQP